MFVSLNNHGLRQGLRRHDCVADVLWLLVVKGVFAKYFRCLSVEQRIKDIDQPFLNKEG